MRRSELTFEQNIRTIAALPFGNADPTVEAGSSENRRRPTTTTGARAKRRGEPSRFLKAKRALRVALANERTRPNVDQARFANGTERKERNDRTKAKSVGRDFRFRSRENASTRVASRFSRGSTIVESAPNGRASSSKPTFRSRRITRRNEDDSRKPPSNRPRRERLADIPRGNPFAWNNASGSIPSGLDRSIDRRRRPV